MTVKVLFNKAEIERARDELRRRGLSAIESRTRSFLRRLGLNHAFHVGDRVKSWDVLETIRFLERHLPKTAPILDIGAYASEVPIALHRLGYSELHAIDLNRDLSKMPHSGHIRYRIGDFMDTPYPDRSLAAITAISVIEHGFDPARLLCEVARLLQPGGYFIASFDYWPDKIDTADIKFFDMDWLIFSADDVRAFCGDARRAGLRPIGDLALAAKDRAITYGGVSYTFAWLVLQRVAEGETS